MPRINRLPGLDGKVMAEKEGSPRREDSDYNIEMRIKGLEIMVRKLEEKLKTLVDKIKVVQRVTRDRNGRETIIVK